MLRENRSQYSRETCYFLFSNSFDERLYQDNKDKAPIKYAIKAYHVQRDLELEFELELELEERLNNDLAQERYYIQD